MVVAAGVAIAVEAPRGVSPGAIDRVAVMRDGCTTFSWQEIDGAASYELIAYELAGDDEVAGGIDPKQVREAFFVRVPGGATSWTPEAADCLAPGGHYAWFVRAELDADTGEATAWSAPLLFAVAVAPTAAEVEQALSVLLRYVEEGTEPGRVDGREIANLARQASAKTSSRSVQTGTAAIKGEQPDPTGETYGVVGTSASPDGAGLGAANTGGGPDLVLDGSADLQPDAELSQSGIDRPWATAQTFNIQNSAGNGMTLQVDGTEVVTTASDQDTLAALACVGDEVAKWSGSAWVCAPDEDTNTDTLAGLVCGSGQVAKWNGSAWSCAPDDDVLATLGCSSSQVAKWDAGGWVCAVDEDSTYLPGPGLILDGSEIRIDPAAFIPRITTVDDGFPSSVVIGADGLGLICYRHRDTNDLMVAHCNDVACTSATLSTLDSGCDAGRDSSLAIGGDGLGLISYYDFTNEDLKVAHCNDVVCTSATLSILDSDDDVGRDSSLAIGGDGLGLISYHDRTNDDLKVAHCSDVACTSATLSTLDTDPTEIRFRTSIAIGTDGLGLIGYGDYSLNTLKVAHCSDVVCTSATLSTLGIGAGDSALAIGTDGLGLIVYSDGNHLGTAHCDDIACTSFTGQLVDKMSYASNVSLAIGADGLGLISYSDWGDSPNEYRLVVAHCLDTVCSAGRISFVDAATWEMLLTGPTSLVIGADGRGLLAYRDWRSGLDVAHLPFWF